MNREEIAEWISNKEDCEFKGAELEHPKFRCVTFTVDVAVGTESGEIEVTCCNDYMYMTAESGEDYTYSIPIPMLKQIAHMCDFIQENVNLRPES